MTEKEKKKFTRGKNKFDVRKIGPGAHRPGIRLPGDIFERPHRTYGRRYPNAPGAVSGITILIS
jgi:hypothetical protein